MDGGEMKNIRKFITRYKGVELARDKYYGFSMNGLHIHAKTFGENANGIILYDINHNPIVDDVDFNSIVRVSKCYLFTEQWHLDCYLFDSDRFNEVKQ